MGLDGFTLLALLDELRPAVVNTRVDRIFQPGREELVFLLRGPRETYTLVMSADARLARLHLGAQPSNPPTPPPFCMALRKHLGGSRLVSVRQDGLERVVFFDFEAYDEFAGVSVKRVYLEIMGRHSNIILTGPDGIVIDAIKRIDERQSRLREVQPGLAYSPPPPQPKLDPRKATIQDLATVIGRSDPEARLQDVLAKRLAGVSPLLARELLFRARLPLAGSAGEFSASVESLWEQLSRVNGMAESSSWQPTAAFEIPSGHLVDFSCVPLEHLRSAAVSLKGGPLNGFVAQAFESKAEGQRFAVQTQRMLHVIGQALERARKRREIHGQTIGNEGAAETWRVYGELLLSAGSRAGRGGDSISLPNYFDPNCGEIVIPLNPAMDARENAQAYFKKYAKAKRGRQAAQEQLRVASEEIEYLETVQEALRQATSLQVIEEIRSELEMGGFLREPGRRRRNPAQSQSQPLRFKSADGPEILVGRNNLQNDRVTTELAGPNDLWFHVQRIPGSHVIVRLQGPQAPSEVTLWEAANLAAFFSRSRGSSKVPVDYTLRKHVRKPPGSRPGAVLYDNFRTITVDPDPDVLVRFNLKLEL